MESSARSKTQQNPTQEKDLEKDEWRQHPQTKKLLQLLKDSELAGCLSWGNREFYDENNVDRTRSLNDRALGSVAALREVIEEIESPFWSQA